MRPIRQPSQPLSLIPPQPGVHRLPRHPHHVRPPRSPVPQPRRPPTPRDSAAPRRSTPRARPVPFRATPSRSPRSSREKSATHAPPATTPVLRHQPPHLPRGPNERAGRSAPRCRARCAAGWAMRSPKAVVVLQAAGQQPEPTTTHLLGNGLVALLGHPDQFQLLRGTPPLAATAIEELLRCDSPVRITGRTAVDDTQIDGVPVRAGDRAVCYLGAANRDPQRFADPGRLDITRKHNSPLSYGGSIHYGLGGAACSARGAARVPCAAGHLPRSAPRSRSRAAGQPHATGISQSADLDGLTNATLERDCTGVCPPGAAP
jgi:hypothetical protein